MSDKNILPHVQKSSPWILLLELAVPILAFGGVLLSMLFSGTEYPIDIRFFASGCVLGSFILAFLAWIRPRKDIVALTTPVYSLLFFIVPSDFAVNLFLELLYAVSLTILLIRLKFRFGTAAESVIYREKSLEGPLKAYCDTICMQVPDLNPEVSHYAAVVFYRFAGGDFREAAEAAMLAKANLVSVSPAQLLATAFDIVREQALLLEESTGQPDQFIEFSASDAALLAKPLPQENQLNERFEQSLDNALLVLYAVAWNNSVPDRSHLLGVQGFALRLLTP